MKLFNKKNKDDFGFGSSEIINDETAAIISKLGSDDIEFEPIQSPDEIASSATESEPAKQQKPDNPPPQPQPDSQAQTQAKTETDSTMNTSTTSQSSSQFGIRDAIALINSLPGDNIDIVIPVVIKTLESANIKLDDILTDADKHEKILETRSEHLIKKIEALETKLNSMSDQVMTLNEHLESITKVKEMLSIYIDDGSQVDDVHHDFEAEEYEEHIDDDTVTELRSAIDEIPIGSKPKKTAR